MTYPERSAKTVVLTLLLTSLTVGFAASLVIAIDVYLLIFLAILVAVMFANLARWLGKLTSLPYVANLAVTVTVFLAASIGTVMFFGLRIEEQVRKTSDEFDQAFVDLEDWLQRHPTVKTALRRAPFMNGLMEEENKSMEGSKRDRKSASDQSGRPRHEEEQPSNAEDANETIAAAANKGEGLVSAGWSSVGTMSSISGRVFGALGKLFSTTFGVAMNVAFILFVAVFLAAKPHFYRDNVTLLFPPSRRKRVTEILNAIGDTLFNWLQGRAATMLITGIGTGIVLWMLGVPLAFTLGVVTGLLTFIPNIGGLLALLLSMLVALSQGPNTVMWVVVAYAVLQFVESNLITPLIQQHQTSVPPPVLLSAQLMMGVLIGFLGVLVATPLVAAATVVIREGYIRDVLEDGPS